MRIEGWDLILNYYIRTSQSLVFSWGENDCCLWVARFADLITNSNLEAKLKNKYNTSRGAQKIMQENGFKNTSQVADCYFSAKPLSMAMRGDIVMHKDGALGICDGRKSYFLLETSGLIAANTNDCLKAWGV